MNTLDLRRSSTIAVGVAAGLGLFRASAAVIGELHNLLLMVLAALFLSFAFEPAVAALERRGARRGAATGFLLFTTTFVIIGVFAVAGAVAVSQFDVLLDRLPRLAAELDDQLTARGFDNELSTWGETGGVIERWSSELRTSLMERGSSALPLAGYALAVGFLTFYFSVDAERIRHQFARLAPPTRRSHLEHVWDVAVEKTGRYLYSRIVLATLSTVVHVAAFSATGIPYPIPLGIWVGVVSQLVPVLGAYLAGLLPVAVSLTYSTGLAVTSLTVVVIYQQIENLIVAPRITRSTVHLHPAAGFLAVLAGAATIGPLGALLAVPTAATIAAVVEGRTVDRDEPESRSSEPSTDTE